MEKISDRISQIANIKGISIRALEQRIGCSNGVLSKCILKGTDIGSVWVSKILEILPDINAKWLLTGEGEMMNRTILPNFSREENLKFLSIARYHMDFENKVELISTYLQYYSLPSLMEKSLRTYRLNHRPITLDAKEKIFRHNISVVEEFSLLLKSYKTTFEELLEKMSVFNIRHDKAIFMNDTEKPNSETDINKRWEELVSYLFGMNGL